MGKESNRYRQAAETRNRKPSNTFKASDNALASEIHPEFSFLPYIPVRKRLWADAQGIVLKYRELTSWEEHYRAQEPAWGMPCRYS